MLVEDDDENFLCPKCMTILECHGFSGYTNIHNIPVEQEVSYYWCPKCREVVDDE